MCTPKLVVLDYFLFNNICFKILVVGLNFLVHDNSIQLKNNIKIIITIFLIVLCFIDLP